MFCSVQPHCLFLSEHRLGVDSIYRLIEVDLRIKQGRVWLHSGFVACHKMETSDLRTQIYPTVSFILHIILHYGKMKRKKKDTKIKEKKFEIHWV